MIKKNLFACLIVGLFSIPLITFSQTGVNTENPQGIFHVDGMKNNGSSAVLTTVQQSDDFIVTPSGNVGIGTTTPEEKLDVNGSAKIRLIESLGLTPDYVLTIDATNTIKKVLVSEIQPKADATRFLGGTVYVRFGTVGTGSLDVQRVIGKKTGSSYDIGRSRASSSIGQIVVLKGQGYTISSPRIGVFDILFDTPLQEIYGISVNIVDSYGPEGGYISNGASPITRDVGMRLLTNDNAQVAYISNSIIRVKTGDNAGAFANRSFTFLVTGK